MSSPLPIMPVSLNAWVAWRGCYNHVIAISSRAAHETAMRKADTKKTLCPLFRQACVSDEIRVRLESFMIIDV